jgi:phosphoglucomutase
MTITEMVRSLGRQVFLPLVALCMVGVFSFVSFADEATTDKPANGAPIGGLKLVVESGWLAARP